MTDAVTDVDTVIAPDDIDDSFVPRLGPDLHPLPVGGQTVLLGRFGQALVLNDTAVLVWQFLDGRTALGGPRRRLRPTPSRSTPRRFEPTSSTSPGRWDAPGLLEGVAEPIDPDSLVEIDWSPPEPIAVGEVVETPSLTDLEGAPASLEAWRGRRVLLVHWSPTCGFCVTTAAELAAAEEGTRRRRNRPRAADLRATPTRTAACSTETGLRAPALLRTRR